MKISAQTAKAIRVELKKAFPGIKFRVTSQTYSGGSSVSISYQDGVLTSKVDEVVKKYQMGHFDGMTDSYEYSNYSENLPQVKFVQVSREMSDAAQEQIFNYIKENFAGCANLVNDPSSNWRTDVPEFGETLAVLIRREFFKTEF